MTFASEQQRRLYYKGLLESLIFLSAEPVKLSHLSSSTKLEKSEIRDIVDELILDYTEKEGGFLLVEIANGYQFVTNPIYYEFLNKVFREKKRETLSKGTLDTLAIIAYKQPITLPEIEEIRGVNSRAIVTSLTSKKLVKAVGQKEVPGRPTLYGTTKDFLLHFGLNKLADLPPPAEIKELNFENLEELESKFSQASVDDQEDIENYPKAEDEEVSSGGELFTEEEELLIPKEDLLGVQEESQSQWGEVELKGEGEEVESESIVIHEEDEIQEAIEEVGEEDTPGNESREQQDLAIEVQEDLYLNGNPEQNEASVESEDTENSP